MMSMYVSGKDGTTFCQGMPGKCQRAQAPNVPSIEVQVRGREVHVAWPQPLPQDDKTGVKHEAALAELRLTLSVTPSANHAAGRASEIVSFADAPSDAGEHTLELPADEGLLAAAAL